MNKTDISERWRPVIGFEGFYEVSNLGQVRSVARWGIFRNGKGLREGRLLKQKVARRYWSVNLCKGKINRHLLVHRLVAEAFVAGIGPVVRHLDGNGFNNSVHNLSWGTHLDNEADKRRHGRRPMGEKHHNSKMTDEDVRKIRKLRSRGLTQLSIAKALGLTRGVVCNVVRNRSWTHVN